MILSDKEVKKRLILQQDDIKQAKTWWENGEWDRIGTKIVIDPFKPYFLGPCCYSLTVGEEYVSLREPDNTKPLKAGERIPVGPSETVLILTQEYICLPKTLLAMIVPRAALIFEGALLSTTRIDPTWYGKLIIGFTNLAKNPVALPYGEKFCTCYFMETTETEGALTRPATDLGREHINIQFAHAKPQDLKPSNKVTVDDIDKVVTLYAWPWDVVRGMFELTKREIGEWIEKEVTSDIVAEATAAAEKSAFEKLSKLYDEQTKWMRNLIIGILTIFGGAVIGYLIKSFT